MTPLLKMLFFGISFFLTLDMGAFSEDCLLCPECDSAFLFETICMKDPDSLEAYLLDGSDVNAICFGDNESLLHKAVIEGNFEIVNILLAFKPKINARNILYETPLHLATLEGSIKIIRALVNAGANVNAFTFLEATPLCYAIRVGDMETILYLLENGGFVNSQKFKLSQSPLHLAVQFGNVELVSLLLDKNAAVNQQNAYHQTPLDLAKDPEIVNKLVEAGGVRNKTQSPNC